MTTQMRLKHRWELSLKWIIRAEVSRCRLDSYVSGQGSVACSFEHSNELWVSIKGGEFLHVLSDYQRLKKDSVQRALKQTLRTVNTGSS